MELMERFVRAAVARGAQSLHIKAGDVFRARIHGDLVALSESPFSGEETRRIALRLLPNETLRRKIDEIRDLDFAWELEGVARFRVNVLQQRGTYMVVMRVIPWHIPTLEELNLPPVLAEIAEADDGMILVTGATGVGKSTTQAALIGWVNEHRKKHIVTLEDPIEFWHDNRLSTVTQREVGTDTESFRRGLRAALRQDPDIILIGEMRDFETAEIAVEAAETGHLVISTMHAPTTTGAIKHLLALFPDKNEELVRVRVADTLRAVLSQRLVRTADGQGSVPAMEVLRVTETVRDCILRGETHHEILALMEQGKDQYGTQSFDQHLMSLVAEGVVDYETARRNSTNPSDFELYMRTLQDDGGTASASGEGDARPAPGELITGPGSFQRG